MDDALDFVSGNELIVSTYAANPMQGIRLLGTSVEWHVPLGFDVCKIHFF